MSDETLLPGGAGVEAILGPFRALASSLSIAIEDASGTRVGGTSLEEPPRRGLSRAIVAGPLAGGRVVAWGPSASTPLAIASIESLAIALGIAHTAGGAGIADVSAARRIEQELVHGRRLQRSFVSLVAPDIPGYELASHYEAAREVGGDFFDLFRIRRRGRPLSVVIADVSGKGIAAALLMAFSRPLLHAAIDNTAGPAEALERTNQILVQERRSSLFITALCASLSLPTGRLRLANAGHEPPLIVPGDGSPIVPVDGRGAAARRLRLPRTVRGGGRAWRRGCRALLHGRRDRCAARRAASGSRRRGCWPPSRPPVARQATSTERPPRSSNSIRAAVTDFQAGLAPADDITIVAVGRRRAVVRRSRRVASAGEG